MSVNTNGWLSFPFEAEGTKFVSKISPQSPLLSRIKSLPAGVFDSMNRSAVAELVGSGLSREYIISKLAYINEGGTHAIIELAE
jgi:hypothetical protein